MNKEHFISAMEKQESAAKFAKYDSQQSLLLLLFFNLEKSC